jgi:hypothetical protein
MGAMERAAGPQTPYESYCFNCRVTFPADARRCIHCGRPIGRRDPKGARPIAAELPAEDEATQEASLLRRVGSISLWVLVALGAALSRLCQEG